MSSLDQWTHGGLATLQDLQPEARRQCDICVQLADREYALQKYGREEGNTYLPAAAGSLTIVKDLSPYGSRSLQVRQCPQCGCYYLYRTDYEYLVNGSEDEEFLTRLSAAEAAAYLGQG